MAAPERCEFFWQVMEEFPDSDDECLLPANPHNPTPPDTTAHLLQRLRALRKRHSRQQVRLLHKHRYDIEVLARHHHRSHDPVYCESMHDPQRPLSLMPMAKQVRDALIAAGTQQEGPAGEKEEVSVAEAERRLEAVGKAVGVILGVGGESGGAG
ncbi:hypothetical protein BC936DRAFT_145778, partial [Jimgerdemannia flammicorona]